MRLTLNQRHCGHASLCWLETLGSAKFRAHERRSPDQKRLEDRRSRSKPRRNTGAQLTSTRYGRSAWHYPAWRRAQHTAHPRSRFAENSWRVCLLIVRLSRVRLWFALTSTTAPNCSQQTPDVYYVTDHYLNYTSVLVRLSRVTPDVLRDLLGMAHKFVTSPDAARRSPPRIRRKAL